MEEYSIRVERLHQGYEVFQRPGILLTTDPWSCLARSSFKIYKELLLLECYATMQFCAFSKILKKHDKVTGRSTRNAFMEAMVHGANFSNTARLQEMIQSCHERYNEASAQLEGAGRQNLQEDERLFINMVSQINNDVLTIAHSEGVPGVANAASRASASGIVGTLPKEEEDSKPASTLPAPKKQKVEKETSKASITPQS